MPDAAITTSRKTVTVGCKLPAGMILELDNEVMVASAMTGGKEVKTFVPSGRTVELIGSNAMSDSSPQNKLIGENGGRVVMGCGLTEVEADFWNEWSAQKKGFPPLTLGMIFATPTANDARNEAKSRASLKTGMEPRQHQEGKVAPADSR